MEDRQAAELLDRLETRCAWTEMKNLGLMNCSVFNSRLKALNPS